MNTPEQLLDRLRSPELLRLALTQEDPSRSTPPFSLPKAEELSRQFPDLEFIELVGTGGMGCVYRAIQKKLDRTVAVKILPKELAGDPLFAERFSREARAMARLNHPNIVAVHDFGVAGDLHFLIMEYMDGMNLRELLDAGDLSPQDALTVFEQVCAALAYAHREGVVHRDIKPENILFDRNGHLALADFGLARLAMDTNAAVSLTQTRQAMGTLNYMAPEQWENPKTVDQRADIYALGVLLYELLTGRIPRGSFPPAASLADVPDVVDKVINKALQSDAAARYVSVEALSDELTASSGESAANSHRTLWQPAQHGTFTNLLHAGARVIRVVPGSPAADEPRAERQAVILSIVVTVLVIIGMLFEWTTSDYYRNGFEVHSYIGGVELPCAGVAVCCCLAAALAFVRRFFGRLRTDFLMLVCVAAAITPIVAGIDEGFESYSSSSSRLHGVSVAPFFVIAVLGFHAVEIIFRMWLQIWRPSFRLLQRSFAQVRLQTEQASGRLYRHWQEAADRKAEKEADNEGPF